MERISQYCEGNLSRMQIKLPTLPAILKIEGESILVK